MKRFKTRQLMIKCKTTSRTVSQPLKSTFPLVETKVYLRTNKSGVINFIRSK